MPAGLAARRHTIFGESSKALGDYAWWKENNNDQTHPVGEKKPNAWGFYDMHGNVNEWCSDWYDQYPKGPVFDPVGPVFHPVLSPRKYWGRIYRGGAWGFSAEKCRSASRFLKEPGNTYSFIGFRVAMSSSESPN